MVEKGRSNSRGSSANDKLYFNAFPILELVTHSSFPPFLRIRLFIEKKINQEAKNGPNEATNAPVGLYKNAAPVWAVVIAQSASIIKSECFSYQNLIFLSLVSITLLIFVYSSCYLNQWILAVNSPYHESLALNP